MRRCEIIGNALIFAAKIDYRSVQINNTAFHREIFQGDSRYRFSLLRVYIIISEQVANNKVQERDNARNRRLTGARLRSWPPENPFDRSTLREKQTAVSFFFFLHRKEEFNRRLFFFLHRKEEFYHRWLYKNDWKVYVPKGKLIWRDNLSRIYYNWVQLQ